VKLCDRVHLVGSGRLGFGISHRCDCHVYLIDGGSELALIDTGSGLSPSSIMSQIVADGFDPTRVSQLIVTHGHGDHVGGAAALGRLLGEGVVLSTSRAIADAVSRGDEETLSVRLSRDAGIYPESFRLEPSPVGRPLDDGDKVRVGDLTLEIIDTPGHADGHICVLLEHGERRILFAGDLVFFGGMISLLTFPDCRLDLLVASLRKIRNLEITTLLAGHGGLAITDGQAHIEEANSILDRARIPPSLVCR
jgi:glyoxylase-like metal-dependent hydrolase (beta-lactamase superfamily II)